MARRTKARGKPVNRAGGFVTRSAVLDSDTKSCFQRVSNERGLLNYRTGDKVRRNWSASARVPRRSAFWRNSCTADDI